MFRKEDTLLCWLSGTPTLKEDIRGLDKSNKINWVEAEENRHTYMIKRRSRKSQTVENVTERLGDTFVLFSNLGY